MQAWHKLRGMLQLSPTKGSPTIRPVRTYSFISYLNLNRNALQLKNGHPGKEVHKQLAKMLLQRWPIFVFIVAVLFSGLGARTTL